MTLDPDAAAWLPLGEAAEANHATMRDTTMTTMITDTILGLGTAALSVASGAVLAVALGLVPLAS